VRVPVEVVKQRQQVGQHNSTLSALGHALKTEGVRRGLYRGYLSTIAREIPFSAIQFPLWEYMKSVCATRRRAAEATAAEAAVCGAVAGGFSAGVTTPLDVAKTRIMIASRTHEAELASGNIASAIRIVYREKGWPG
jgi:solute carrier family 25 S-adenosylmethionine transporter 26